MPDRYTDTPPAFHPPIAPESGICELDVVYCLLLSREMRHPGSRRRLADGLLETHVRRRIEAHAHGPLVHVAWRRGEPTRLGIAFLRRAVELVERHLAPGQRAAHSMQTDGMRLDPEWAAFLAAHRFLVSVPIDGPCGGWRRDTQRGGGGCERVIGGLAHLRAGGVSYDVLTTVHAANQDRGVEVYRFLRDDCQAQFMQFIPLVERVGAGVSGRSVSAEGYGRFLIDVFEEWVRHDVGSVSVATFDCALADWLGDEPCPAPGERAERHPVAPCAADGHDWLPGCCRACDVRFACHGGRPGNRFATAPDGEPGLDYLCPSSKRFFAHVARPMRLMTELLALEHDPAEIVEIYAEADARRRRNGPCTCGSGRTFKRCHGRAARALAAR